MAKKASTIRIFELAKELGVTSKDLIAKCEAEGVPAIKNHMSTVSLGLAATVREWFGEPGSTSATTAVETAARVDVAHARAKAKKKVTGKAMAVSEKAAAAEAPAPEVVAEPTTPPLPTPLSPLPPPPPPSLSPPSPLPIAPVAKHLGATVIGTVGSDAKGKIAKQYGCDHVINYSTENFAERVRDITDGAGVPVAYDGVGKATFEGSIDSLAIRGMLVGYGNASGNFPEFDPLLLMDKGSLYFQRTSMRHFVRNRRELEEVSGQLMDLVSDGTIRIEIGKSYALEDARQAHIDMENRKTTGSVIYLP